MKTFDGLQLHVRIHGPEEAPLTVVLAHCWTSDHDSWRYQVRDLQHAYGHQIKIVTYDHRGHGESDAAVEADCRLDVLARDLGDVIDHYAPSGLLVLGGHSLGGMTIMALAERRPELFDRVVGTVLTSTSAGGLVTVTLGLPEVGGWAKDRIPALLALRARTLSRSKRRRSPTIETFVARRFLFGQPARVRDVALAVEGIINCPPATFSGYFRELMRHNRIEALQVVGRAPVRILVGSHDKLTPVQHARVIAANTPGAKLQIAPGAGHMLPLERDQLVTSALADLVKDGLAQAATRELASTAR